VILMSVVLAKEQEKEARRGALLDLCDGESLVAALRAGNAAAPAILFDRYGARVQRILVRVLGADREVADLIQEVFLRALENLHRLRDGDSLASWLTSIAVFTARECIRRRRRWRWLVPLAPSDLPPVPVSGPNAEATEALRAVYAVLDDLRADERIAFALRFVEGMELTEVAEACDVSLSTAKRRLARAEERFTRGARAQPSLARWIQGGGRWTRP
jgi:RNA polymerase sigma-70 factor (ECF subfamily)